MFGKVFLIPAIVVISFITGAFLASNFSMTPSVTSVPSGGEELSLKYTGALCVYINGKEWECKKNLFTDLGKNYTKQALLGAYASNVITEFIGVSRLNSSQAGTDIALQGEYGVDYPACGMGRAAATTRNTTVNCETSSCPGNFTVTNEFTSTCDSRDVNATGLFDVISGSTLFALANFTTATLNTNDKINVTWFIWVR